LANNLYTMDMTCMGKANNYQQSSAQVMSRKQARLFRYGTGQELD